MQHDLFAFKATDLWSAVALLTASSLLGYFLVGVLEALVLARYVPVRGADR